MAAVWPQPAPHARGAHTPSNRRTQCMAHAPWLASCHVIALQSVRAAHAAAHKVALAICPASAQMALTSPGLFTQPPDDKSSAVVSESSGPMTPSGPGWANAHARTACRMRSWENVMFRFLGSSPLEIHDTTPLPLPPPHIQFDRLPDGRKGSQWQFDRQLHGRAGAQRR